MIYDKLDNINLYKNLSDGIYEGLIFLKNATSDIANGVYQLNHHVKAIISEYQTKKVNAYGYEAHKKFIDIQCVLKGEEIVRCLPIESMNETKPYNEEKDAAFYETNSQAQEMVIGNGYFAIFYPQDGHMPQLYVNEPQMVKKVVVKVEIAY